MKKPVFLMTVQEAHKEYNSLTDKIRTKYEQLDSGQFGSPGMPAFDAEACELANLLACVSQLCRKLTEAMWVHFASVAVHPSQLRITGYPRAYDMHIIKLCCCRQLQVDWQNIVLCNLDRT